MKSKKHPHIRSKYDHNITWSTRKSDTILEQNKIHIWSVRVCEHFHDLFRRYRFLLREDDFDRIKNLYRADDVKKYLTSRIILRILAGRYLSLPPTRISFCSREGKPSLLGVPLKFNLSYTKKTVLISFGMCETGVDIEEVKPDFDFSEILSTCFSIDEKNEIGPDNGDSSEKFFLQWTRKEALLKYTGQGIIDDLTVIPSRDGYHPQIHNNLKIGADINLLSFRVNDDCVGSIAYPATVTSVDFIEWQ
jgi:4'-phosphopantetheinyl transferase